MPPRRRRIARDTNLGCDYSRFSTEMQGSIPEQQSINEELAYTLGITLLPEARFTDAGVSRSISDRPGLLELFAFLEEHPEVGFIVVNELERLTAGVTQRAELARRCQLLDVSIVTEDMGVISPFDADKMQDADQRAVAAKGEVLKLRRRTKRSLRARVANGATVAMRPAFGTRMKALIGPDGKPMPSGARYIDRGGKVVRSGVLEVHPDEIKWLRKIFEWADAGTSNEAIAEKLTEQRVPTKNGRTVWRGNTIAGILSNPLYKGELIWGRTATIRPDGAKSYLEVRPEGDPGRLVLPSPLGALIDPVVWDRIEQRRLDRLGQRQMVRRTTEPQVLDGFVFCGRCGYRMYAVNDNAGKRGARRTPTFRYKCNSRGERPVLDGFGPPCGKPLHSLSVKKILAAIAEPDQPGGRTVRPVRHREDRVAQQRLQKELRDAEAKRARVGQMYKAGFYKTEDEFTTDLAEADVEIAIAKGRLDATLETEQTRMAVSYVATTRGWDQLAELVADPELPVADRAAALRGVGIGRIYVDAPVVEIEFTNIHAGLESGLLGEQDGDLGVDAG